MWLECLLRCGTVCLGQDSNKKGVSPLWMFGCQCRKVGIHVSHVNLQGFGLEKAQNGKKYRQQAPDTKSYRPHRIGVTLFYLLKALPGVFSYTHRSPSVAESFHNSIDEIGEVSLSYTGPVIDF